MQANLKEINESDLLVRCEEKQIENIRSTTDLVDNQILNKMIGSANQTNIAIVAKHALSQLNQSLPIWATTIWIKDDIYDSSYTKHI